MAGDVDVLIVNYNGASLLRPCLESVRKLSLPPAATLRTLVVDNGSSDGSAEMVAAAFPEVTVASLERNLGFAGGVSEGLRRTSAPWVLMLNNDATIERDALGHLIEAASDPAVGAVAAQMRFSSRPEVINSAGIEVDVLGVAVDRLLGDPADAGAGAREVFGASAGAALYRRRMLDEIGGFDPEYFVYLEDVDVAWRARAAGWRTMYAPAAIVWHHHAATAVHGSSFKYFHVGRNRVRLLARNATTRQLAIHGPAILAHDLAYVGFVAARERTLAPLRGRIAGLREWREYRELGSERRRPVQLARRSGMRAALRRRAAWPSGTGPADAAVDGAVDQDLAYETAVRAARSDPSLREVAERAFLQEDPLEALESFLASEDWARTRRLLARSGTRPGARVLDFGGGRGLMTAALALEGYTAVLVETNPSAVCGTGAAEELRARTGASFEIESGSAPDGPHFDAVVCRAVLHHVDPLVPVLRQVVHRLRPGGAFIAVDEPTIRRESDLPAHRSAHPFTPFGVDEPAFPAAYYRAALEAAGLSDVRTEFPVAFRDYRRSVRPELASLTAAAGYGVYRLRAAVSAPPGAVRAFTASRPR